MSALFPFSILDSRRLPGCCATCFWWPRPVPPPRRCSSLPAGSRRLACPLGSWPVFDSTMSRSAPPRPGCRQRPVPSSCTGEDGSSLGPRGRGASCWRHWSAVADGAQPPSACTPGVGSTGGSLRTGFEKTAPPGRRVSRGARFRSSSPERLPSEVVVDQFSITTGEGVNRVLSTFHLSFISYLRRICRMRPRIRASSSGRIALSVCRFASVGSVARRGSCCPVSRSRPRRRAISRSPCQAAR